MTAFQLKSSRPDTLSPLAQRTFDVLASYTSFPWPILAAQCHRFNLDPAALTPAGLAIVMPALAEAVGRFTSVNKAAAVATALQELLNRT